MSTNYHNAFIEVAPDCPVDVAERPPARGAGPSVAELQFRLLTERPYELTSDELLFEVHAIRQGVDPADRDAERERFLARSQACLRASPLPKRYGWGVHHDDAERVALVAVESPEYARLRDDPALEHRAAMRSSRR